LKNAVHIFGSDWVSRFLGVVLNQQMHCLEEHSVEGGGLGVLESSVEGSVGDSKGSDGSVRSGGSSWPSVCFVEPSSLFPESVVLCDRDCVVTERTAGETP